MIIQDKTIIRSLLISLIVSITFVVLGFFAQKSIQKQHDREMKKMIEDVNLEREKIIKEKDDEIYLLRKENDRISKEIYDAYDELIKIDAKLNALKKGSTKKISEIKKMNNSQLEKYWRDEFK
jgi:flagellar motility protein MotE (MotC chaperone)